MIDRERLIKAFGLKPNASIKITKNSITLIDAKDVIFSFNIEPNPVCCGMYVIGGILTTTNIKIYEDNILRDLMNSMVDYALGLISCVCITLKVDGYRNLYLKKALEVNDKVTATKTTWTNADTGSVLTTYLITKK